MTKYKTVLLQLGQQINDGNVRFNENQSNILQNTLLRSKKERGRDVLLSKYHYLVARAGLGSFGSQAEARLHSSKRLSHTVFEKKKFYVNDQSRWPHPC